MEETKLTSIRLRADVLQKIDQIVKDHQYWKRSEVINTLLLAVVCNFNERQIYDMLRRWDWKQNVVKAEFEITKELKAPKDRSNG